MKNNIEISLSEAYNMFISKDPFLKQLALRAFSEETFLNLNFKNFTEDLDFKEYDVSLPPILEKTVQCHLKLLCLALALNKGWKKTNSNKGYFVKSFEDKTVGYHQSVNYPSIVYFKKQKDAELAIELVK